MAIDLVQTIESVPGASRFELRADGYWMDAPALNVPAMAKAMLEGEARLATMTAMMYGEDETQVIYHYALGGSAFHIKVLSRQNSLPSITPITAAADWVEREISDLYAVTFQGHPNPVRLVRPAQLQPGYFREPGGEAGKVIRNHVKEG